MAETEYRRAIETIIEPFKGLLLGAFFLMVGLGIDLHGFVESALGNLGNCSTTGSGKAAITYGFARLLKVKHTAALETSLLLGPCGEFAFVVLSASAALAHH